MHLVITVIGKWKGRTTLLPLLLILHLSRTMCLPGVSSGHRWLQRTIFTRWRQEWFPIMGLPWALGHVNSSLLGTTDTVLQFWGLNSERCTCYTKATLNTKSSAGTISLSCVRRLCAHMLTQASDNLGVLFGNPVHLL